MVVNSENHTTLEEAIVAAGLVETLSGDGPFTVFAPTDDDCSLLEGMITAWLGNPTGYLNTYLLIMFIRVTYFLLIYLTE